MDSLECRTLFRFISNQLDLCLPRKQNKWKPSVYLPATQQLWRYSGITLLKSSNLYDQQLSNNWTLLIFRPKMEPCLLTFWWRHCSSQRTSNVTLNLMANKEIKANLTLIVSMSIHVYVHTLFYFRSVCVYHSIKGNDVKHCS